MIMGKKIIKFIGWALIVAGFIMRFTGVAFSGEYLAHRGGWTSSVLDGKALVLFGLIFLVYYYLQFSKKKEQNKYD